MASIYEVISKYKSIACPTTERNIDDANKAADKGRKPLSYKEIQELTEKYRIVSTNKYGEERACLLHQVKLEPWLHMNLVNFFYKNGLLQSAETLKLVN